MTGDPRLAMIHLFQGFVARRVSSLPCPNFFFQMKALEGDIHATLAMLRRRINPLESPLYRLPPDLFPEVASHFSEADLVNATHVSYYLRNILLSCPGLWSHLNFKHEMSSRAFFERSGQMPLHLDMPSDTNRTVGLLTELRHQSKRISTLRLHNYSIQKKFLSEPLPSLTRLEIVPTYCEDDWDKKQDAWAQVWGQTEEATSWSFPSVTSLIVYIILPTPFYTPHLTCFKFWDVESPTDAYALIDFLDNCPLLEHIDLFYWDGRPSERDLVVSLPNLRTYTESTSGEVCPLTVLNNLSILPSCSITLRFQDVGTTPEADDTPPRFENPGYLAEIERVKLRTIHDAKGNEVAGTLELVNTRGTMVRSERMDPEEGNWSRVQGDKKHPHNAAHLNFLKDLDGRSVEILCIDGCAWQDEVTVGFLKEALDFGGVGTLILSRRAVAWCLWALKKESNTSGWGRRSLSVHTLIIHPEAHHHHLLRVQVLEPLLGIARKRKVAGFPFRSVSLFLSVDRGWGWDRVLEELRECVEKLEIFAGDDVLNWEIDKYFLDGLDHLQKNWGVQWE